MADEVEDVQSGPESARLRSAFPGWKRWLIPAALGLLLAWFLLGDRGLLRHAELQERIDSLRARRAAAEAEIAFYQDLTARLEAGDSLALEAEARRIGMRRPGEQVYLVELPEDTLEREADR